MSILSSQLVWLLISYLSTKIASKAWGRAILQIGRGYLAATANDRATEQGSRIEQTRPLTPEEHANLSDEDRRVLDHGAPKPESGE